MKVWEGVKEGKGQARSEWLSPRSFSSTPRLSGHAALIAFELLRTCAEEYGGVRRGAEVWGGEGRSTCRGGRREAGREGIEFRSFSSTPRLSSQVELIAFE